LNLCFGGRTNNAFYVGLPLGIHAGIKARNTALVVRLDRGIQLVAEPGEIQWTNGLSVGRLLGARLCYGSFDEMSLGIVARHTRSALLADLGETNSIFVGPLLGARLGNGTY
jgi:hypothetical protein